MINANGNAEAPGGVDEFRGFLDSFGAAGSGAMALGAASRAVHRGTSFAESDSDAASSAARGAGHQGDAAFKLAGLYEVGIMSYLTYTEAMVDNKRRFINVKWKMNGHSVILLGADSPRNAG